MHVMPRMNNVRWLALTAVLALCAAFATGCTTTPDDESEMPWNTPESWEGSPYVPGFGSQ
jgi:hypothetical protein